MERLFGCFIPENYNLSLNINKTSRKVYGTVIITGTPKQSTVKFHAKDLNITSVKIAEQNTNFRQEDNLLILDNLSTEKVSIVVKYTFFLKNKEQEEVNYYIDINLIDSDKTGINEYIRVMLFEGTNKQTVFAKRSKTNSSGKEYLNSNNESLGEAEIFDGTNITGISSSIDADENRMITLLFWLEGDDPECKDVPDNVLLNVEANIRGYKS